MTDLNSEQLNGKYKQAYEFAMNDHLQAKQDLDAAKQEIEELRFKLTEQQVKIDAMDKLNDLYRDQLNMAITDRRLEMDRSAKYAALLAVMHTAMHEAALEDFVKPLENKA
jgi:uncharacterized coiled-coil protein SlyX